MRVGNPLKDSGRRAGFVRDRHHHDVLLLHFAKPRRGEALPRGRQVDGEDVHHAAHLVVAVDVDAGGADTPQDLGQDARTIVVVGDGNVCGDVGLIEVCHGPDDNLASVAKDDEIDGLYQLPLDEFTPARNALAKDAGKGAPEIKRLEKPKAAAWAVNQLYWRERKLYDSLIAASEQLRAAYRLQLAGKSSDVKSAETTHRDLVKKATQAAREILEAAGNASAPVMEAIRETLDTLPGADRPGRLTKPLKRTGFEALQGFTVSASPRPIKTKPQPAKKEPAASELTAKERKASEAEERERKMTTERLRFAEAAEREADAALERTRRAVERAQRMRERIEGELADAAEAEKKLRKEETAREGAHEKTVAERERLEELRVKS